MDFNENDRVTRKNQSGCLGTVVKVREETGTATGEKNKLIKVLWDNGTTSYSDPESIEVAS